MNRHERTQARHEARGRRRSRPENDEQGYRQRLTLLPDEVVGRIVEDGSAENAGYVLRFRGKRWLAAFLDRGRLRWECGRGRVPGHIRSRLRNYHRFGDGYPPLAGDRRHPLRFCEISRELAKARDKPVRSVTPKARCFDLHFPGGMTLRAAVVPGPSQEPTLRVFWERSNE